MILVETKADATAISPLGLANLKDEKPLVSFSELLHGVKETKGKGGIENGSFLVSLGTKDAETKIDKEIRIPTEKESLASLLKNADTVQAEVEEIKVLELNPKLTQKISVKDLKVLIGEAKKFLKDTILESVAYIKSEVKDLPKTLRGLSIIAKKFGIDISKITVEEIRSTDKSLQSLKIDISKDIKVQSKALPVEGKRELRQTVSAKEIPKLELEESVQIKQKVPKVTVAKTQRGLDTVSEVKLKEETKESVKEYIRIDEKKVLVNKEITSTPLFKAQTIVEHTTQELVQTKQYKGQEKTPKARADETLKLLLGGEKALSQDVGATKDFSVATARVIAPTATRQLQKSVEQLLRGDVSDDIVKTDLSVLPEADSFEVKLKEAKQMMRYLSQDIKTAIEDYKSPFTRVKVQLNPQKMGEVDVTVVQRGKNLHVSLSANNVAINTLAMNAQDLKLQLQNNGIQNASLNFSNNSQQSEQNPQGQQNRQNERNADEEYNYFDNEEHNEEILSSLEIVVPNYA